MKYVLCLLIGVCSFQARSQNLVSNSGFENNSALPGATGEYWLATGWSNCNGGGSPDYFHVNGSGLVQLPNCFIGATYPYSGDAIMGFSPYYNLADFREYVSTELINPMVVGTKYNISFYITNSTSAGAYCGQGIDKVGVAFTIGMPVQVGYFPISTITPQWVSPGILYDTAWEQISFQITADAAYDHITFGNFEYDATTNVQTFITATSPGAYYFIDEVSVKEDSSSLVAFLASDTSLCQKFCLNFFDQSLNNPTAWQWSFPGGDPSFSTAQNPMNVCYDVPGVYDVTLITTNANGNDTLTLSDYITVNATPGIPTITQSGYTLTSTAADFYQWQLNAIDIPGATDQSYDALQSGFYTVVVTDLNGCVNSTSLYVTFTGIDELADGSISVYPNPSAGNFVVTLSNAPSSDEISLDVVNALGQIIYSSREKISAADWKKEIDLGSVTPGIYFIEMKTNNFFVRRKINITR